MKLTCCLTVGWAVKGENHTFNQRREYSVKNEAMLALSAQIAAVGASMLAPVLLMRPTCFDRINGRKHNVNCWLDELAILHHFDFNDVLTRCPVNIMSVMHFLNILHECICVFHSYICHYCVRLSSAHLLCASTRCVPAVANGCC